MSAGRTGGGKSLVAIVGAGRVGTAMALLLSERGYRVTSVADSSENARERAAGLSGATPTSDVSLAARDVDLVIITTPDGEIAETCERIAASGVDFSGKKFLHMSGALSLDVLEAARRAGADVLAVHPLQTFADMEGAVKALPGSTFGVTCDPALEDWARCLVDDLGGKAQVIEDSDKVLYHAAAVMASNFIAMVEHAALTVARALGFGEDEFSAAFMPLSKASVDNVARLGPVGALTGPLARGDVGTIEKHLEALERFDPALASLYRQVCFWGLRLVEERGDLDRATIDTMRALLE